MSSRPPDPDKLAATEAALRSEVRRRLRPPQIALGGPVPVEFIGADAEGHVIDLRDGGRLVARGAVSWPERFNGCPECRPMGQGWYHPAALVPPTKSAPPPPPPPPPGIGITEKGNPSR